MKPINRFDGDNRFLSNFFSSPMTFTIPHLSYTISVPTSEHAYQASKATNLNDALFIARQITAGKSKRVGRQIKQYRNWDNVKFQIMLDVVRNKFSQNPNLAKKLLATGNVVLIEGNTWGDTIWGVCDGEGQNLLGKILMQVREELKSNG